MKTCLIYHHLGLGDTIICNGFVNDHADRFDHVFVFCKPIYYTSVEFLYRVNEKVTVLPADDADAMVIYDKLQTDIKKKIGFNLLKETCDLNSCGFDKGFYYISGVDFEKRYTYFKLNRDLNREKNLMNSLGLVSNNYIFLHEDPHRNFIIDRKHIKNSSLPVFFPKNNITDNIFDYCTIIENAKEIHVFDSSFKNLIETLNIQTDQLYYHTYIKGVTTDSIKKWHII